MRSANARKTRRSVIADSSAEKAYNVSTSPAVKPDINTA
jgi:hypothetical protein